MTHDANGAIEVLQSGLKEDEKEGKVEGTVDGVAFREADTLVRSPASPVFSESKNKGADVKAERSCCLNWRGRFSHSAGTPTPVRCSYGLQS